MGIPEFLLPIEALINVHMSGMTRLLQKLADRAASVLNMDASRIFIDLLKREHLECTGTGAGIAIPDAWISDLKKSFVYWFLFATLSTLIQLTASRRSRSFEGHDLAPPQLGIDGAIEHSQISGTRLHLESLT